MRTGQIDYLVNSIQIDSADEFMQTFMEPIVQTQPKDTSIGSILDSEPIIEVSVDLLREPFKILSPHVMAYILLATTALALLLKATNQSNVIWKLLVACFNQSLEINQFKKLSSKMTILMAILMSFWLSTYIYGCYSTNRVVVNQPFIIESLSDLLASKVYPIFRSGDPVTEAFDVSRSSVHRDVWFKARKRQLTYDSREHIKMMNSLVSHEIAVVQGHLENEILSRMFCDMNKNFRVSKPVAGETISSMFASRNSSQEIKIRLRFISLLMIEHGLGKNLMEEFISTVATGNPANCDFSGHGNNRIESIGSKHMKMILLALLLSSMYSFLLLSQELKHYKKEQERKMRRIVFMSRGIHPAFRARKRLQVLK